MPVQIKQLSLERGESIMLLAEGSLELSICVKVTPDGKLIVSGPFNCNSREYQVFLTGMKPIEKRIPPST